jgi:heat shock protein HslJ
MNKQIFLFASTLVLSACQIIPDAQQPESKGQAPYKAAGTEPFWGLMIANGDMTFQRAGEPDVRVSSYEARPSFNGWRYVSDRLTADVTFTRCSDGMSDNVYKDTVTVIADGVEFRGCGGGIVAQQR